MEAKAKVDSVPFLDFNFWRDPKLPGTHPFQVDFMVVSKKGMLAVANWMYQKAVDRGVFTGDNNNTPESFHHQGVADVLCALGWNAGGRMPSKAEDETAWWGAHWGTRVTRQSINAGTAGAQRQAPGTEVVERPAQVVVTPLETVLSHLRDRYQGKAGLQSLIVIVRKGTREGIVPCKKGTKRDKHSYQSCGWKPFRMRCGNQQCRDNLTEAEALLWFASLVARGVVPREAVGLSQVSLSHSVPLSHTDFAQVGDVPAQQAQVCPICPIFVHSDGTLT